MAQVRLEADVEEALRVEADRTGVSVAKLANRVLRRALGLSRAVSAPSEVGVPTGSFRRPTGSLVRRGQR